MQLYNVKLWNGSGKVANYFYVQKNGYFSKRAFGARSKQIFAFARR
jgi:hypothetical protein